MNPLTITGYRTTNAILGGVFFFCSFILSAQPSSAEILLTRAERAFLEKKQTIRFVSQERYAPFEFLNSQGGSDGICVQLARWMADQLNVGAEFTHVAFKEAQEMILDGRQDVLTSLFFSEERAKRFRFSQEMFQVPAHVFTRSDRHEIVKVNDLQDLVIAMQLGDYAEEFLKQAGVQFTPLWTRDFGEAIDLVAKGQADALIGDLQIVQYHAIQNNLGGQIKKIGVPLYVGQNCMATRLDQEILQGILNKAVQHALENGVIDSINNRWIGAARGVGQITWAAELSRVAILISFLGLVIALGYLWNFQLRAQVRQHTSALREQEKKFRTLAESLPDVVMQVDRQKNLLYANPAAIKELHIQLSEEPMSWTQVPPALADPLQEKVSEVLVSEKEAKLHYDGTYEKHRHVWDFKFMPQHHADGKLEAVLIAGRDMTERQLAKEEHENFEEQIRQTQKLESLGLLAGGIAHDFNNLLTAIMGNAELARFQLEENHPTQERLKDIDVSAERAAELCRQMLAYAGRGALTMELLDLNQAIREMGQLLSVSLSKSATLIYELEDELPSVKCDPTQFRQVIMNLITNASDALHAQSGTIVLRTQTRTISRNENRSESETMQARSYVMVEVEDTGCGMDSETQSKIFDPFFTTRFTGRGLGLAAVQGIVRAHHGYVEVQSTAGHGTRMRVFFPAEHRQNRLPQPVGARIGKGRSMSYTILLVDDEAMVRDLTGMMLESLGCRVMLAEGGEEALDIFETQNEAIDLALIDMTMPGMDGVATLSALRKIRPDLPVVIFSGYTNIDLAKRLDGQQATGFLQKPFSLDQLEDVVHDAFPATFSTDLGLPEA